MSDHSWVRQECLVIAAAGGFDGGAAPSPRPLSRASVDPRADGDAASERLRRGLWTLVAAALGSDEPVGDRSGHWEG